MNKNKDSNEQFIKTVLIIITGVFVISLVTIMVMGLLCFKCSSSVNTTLDLSLLLSFLSLAFAIAIATPYFISKNQIKSVVQDYLKKDYKEEIEESVENINRTDAHLSRMMAFILLKQDYYYWAVGWAFRALKRYKNMSDDYQKSYKEFHEFLLRDVIYHSLSKVNNDKSKDIFDTENENDKTELVRKIKIRMVKDYVDFEYEIQNLYKDMPYVKNMNDNFGKILDSIQSSMRAIIAGLYKECQDKKIDLFNEVL